MDALLTFIGYEAVWLSAVIGAGRGLAWPGLGAAAVFVAWRMAVSRSRGLALGLLVLSLVIGGALSYWAAARGWHAVQFPSDPRASLAALAIGWAAALPLLSVAARRIAGGRS
ncbi:MAG: DUF2878 family protein [Gammaproteobacteria bacterium]|nr:DUF2878 family protein [Gammaproteobacteria bacterium]